jgi:hypothetical protein
MLLETTIPASMTIPISDMMFSVVSVVAKTTSTPAIPGGMANKIRSGMRNDLNCATRIK